MKALQICSQDATTGIEKSLLRQLIEVAIEAGYTHVYDVWGWHHDFGEAYDIIEIHEFNNSLYEKPNPVDTAENYDELPF